MEVISAIVEGKQSCWLTRIAQYEIGIHNAVERSARSNPLIERDPRRFVCRRIEPWKTRVPAHRRNRAAEDGKTVFVRASDELPQPRNHVIDRWLLGCRIERARAGEIVQADPNDEGLHAGLSEHVGIE